MGRGRCMWWWRGRVLTSKGRHVKLFCDLLASPAIFGPLTQVIRFSGIVAVIAFSQTANAQVKPRATTAVFSNRSAMPVWVWVESECVGCVEAATAIRIQITQKGRGNAGQPVIGITGVSESASEIRMNSLCVRAPSDADCEVVWGGISSAADVAVVQAKQDPPPAALTEMFEPRWQSLREQDGDKPAPLANLQIGKAWHDRPVRGETLSFRDTRSWRFINSVGMTFVNVPQGSFQLTQVGGPDGRSVKLSSYFIGLTEVTQGQAAIIQGKAPIIGSAGELPLTSISWQDASDLCSQVPAVPGWKYNLPTEAQWERACGGGVARPFDPADVKLDKVMWYNLNSGLRVHVVADRLPSSTGLFDMHGNVREWCRDWWSAVPSVGSNPVGPEKGSQRVRRGGAFDVPADWCRCGARDAGPPDIVQLWLGFRMVMECIETENASEKPIQKSN